MRLLFDGNLCYTEYNLLGAYIYKKVHLLGRLGMSKTYVLQNPATAYSMLLILCILYIVCFSEQIGVLLIPIGR